MWRAAATTLDITFPGVSDAAAPLHPMRCQELKSREVTNANWVLASNDTCASCLRRLHTNASQFLTTWALVEDHLCRGFWRKVSENAWTLLKNDDAAENAKLTFISRHELNLAKTERTLRLLASVFSEWLDAGTLTARGQAHMALAVDSFRDQCQRRNGGSHETCQPCPRL